MVQRTRKRGGARKEGEIGALQCIYGVMSLSRISGKKKKRTTTAFGFKGFFLVVFFLWVLSSWFSLFS